jgi:hypothetical protein
MTLFQSGAQVSLFPRRQESHKKQAEPDILRTPLLFASQRKNLMR